MKLILFTLFILTTSLSHSSPFPLWDENIPVPKKAELEVLDDVDFHVIKKWEPTIDGYLWLHGIGLAWHKGKLYASYG